MAKLVLLVITTLFQLVLLGTVEGDESCDCILALTSDAGFQRENLMYSVTFKDSSNACDTGSADRCRSKCQTGFLRSTGGGDLSHKSRRSPKMIGELLCAEYNRDVTSGQVGLYFKSCDDQRVSDSTTRASRRICCASGQFSNC